LVDGAGDDLARDAHELFLVLDQAQADLLLGDLGVALDGLLLTLEFLIAQVPERGNDGCQKQQHRDQRAERGVAVLAGGRLAQPPAPEQPADPSGGRAVGRSGCCWGQ
jgi:hypothetical protein